MQGGESKENVKLVYDVPEAAELLNICRSTAYGLARQGIIPTLRLGKRIVVPRKALEKLLEAAQEKNEDREKL